MKQVGLTMQMKPQPDAGENQRAIREIINCASRLDTNFNPRTPRCTNSAIQLNAKELMIESAVSNTTENYGFV